MNVREFVRLVVAGIDRVEVFQAKFRVDHTDITLRIDRA